MSTEKAVGEFRKLHDSPELFVMPNPWDIGTVKIFSQCGFKALATTSGGMAYSLGKRDGFATKEDALRHCTELASATELPLSADLEKGFGDCPEEVADMITAVAATGVAGCSIEDYSGNPESAIFDSGLAIERIQAAHEACSTLADDFVLTARCEKFVWNEPDLDAVIERLQAFERAGADVLFAPGIEELEDIKTLVNELNKPVSVLMSTANLPYGLSELQAIGVSRVSIGSSIAQLIYGNAINAIRELAESGTFDFLNDVMDYEELEGWFVG
ncbi:MAG: isocitrate lyase/phosphoenolpyruvate mutase family protein [Acidiferrobacterales bacterium]|nr:isocitrate lyase/phosphoenolpyruvate mutase family protein [Acidiferrobacterales bacterium]